MKKVIGVLGFSGEPTDKQKKLAHATGSYIAEQNCILLTGATTGIPFEAAKGAKEKKGLVIGISPAIDKQEHISTYGLPVEEHDVILYTGFRYQGRNVINVWSCDAVIIIGGSVGTLNEFTTAYANNKLIGILTDSGGITDIVELIVEKLDDRFNPIIIYDSDPVSLVDKLLSHLKKNI